jgi:hypothetical protein
MEKTGRPAVLDRASWHSTDNQREEAQFGRTGLPQKFSNYQVWDCLPGHITTQIPRPTLSACGSTGMDQSAELLRWGRQEFLHHTEPPIEWLKTTELYSHRVQEARSLGQSWFL